MRGLSEHTHLINCIIGLTKRIESWPSTLRDLGFRLEWIGPLLTTKDGETVQPDLLLDSDRLLYALPIECKGGRSIDQDQLKRLLNIDEDSLISRSGVHNPRELQFEISYSCRGEHAEPVVSQISATAPIPVLAFHDDRIESAHEFQREELNGAFRDPIPLSGPPPTSFYPFDENDDNGIVALYVLSEIVKEAIRRTGREPGELEANELLDAIHPLWKAMDDRVRSRLLAKVASVLSEFAKEGRLNSLKRVRRGRSWRIVNTLQALRDECQQLVDELTEQRQIEEF